MLFDDGDLIDNCVGLLQSGAGDHHLPPAPGFLRVPPAIAALPLGPGTDYPDIGPAPTEPDKAFYQESCRSGKGGLFAKIRPLAVCWLRRISLELKTTMTIHIELQPEEEQALLERARMSGNDLAGYIHQILQGHLRTSKPEGDELEPGNGPTSTSDDLIDWEAIESCAREVQGKDVPSIEEVRQILSKIPGSMAQAVIEEREDRF
jgi:hypothetical protein